MSYTDQITCPHCNQPVELEVTTRYDEPDDVEIKPIIREEANPLKKQPQNIAVSKDGKNLDEALKSKSRCL